MTTNTNAINVLCYGDSNTWGQKPDKSGRYPVDARWTGRLQNLLGDDYYIIEEGLGSRTTDLEYDKKPGRNGKTYLVPCVQSHNPIDIVILMLGTNDLKTQYHRSPQAISQAIEGLVKDLIAYSSNGSGESPQILLISPIHIDDNAANFKELYEGVYDADSAATSRNLASPIKQLAQQTECHFFDASTVAAAGSDGIHFSEAAHVALAGALEGQIHRISHEL